MTGAADDTMLEIAVNAAAGGHDLAGFEPVEDADGNPNGYQARCRNCSQTVWVGFGSVIVIIDFFAS